MLSYDPKTVMAFLSNEVMELRYICVVFLREVLARDIFGARCSEYVDFEVSSSFDVSLVLNKLFFLFAYKLWCLSIVHAGFYS